jgi:large subunit ribosomal protein L23
MDYHRIIKRPIVTEKSTQMLQQGNHYVFEVADDANKIEIARAVEGLFSVEVTRVRTFNILGKERRMGWRKGRRPSWKKAIVTLKAGQTIPVIEGV